MKASERHRLKHDAYGDSVWTAFNWIREHRVQVLIGVAAVLVVAAIASWMTLVRQRITAEANDAFAEIKKKASSALSAEGDKQKELLNQLTGDCEALAMDYPNTDVAPQALLFAGQILTATSKPGAADYYAQVLELSSTPPGLRDIALNALAGALESDKKYAEAITEYKKILAKASGEAKDEAHWNIARCREMMGEVDVARAEYEALAEGNLDNPWAQLARTRILFLDNPPKEEAETPDLSGFVPGMPGIGNAPTGEANNLPSIPTPLMVPPKKEDTSEASTP